MLKQMLGDDTLNPALRASICWLSEPTIPSYQNQTHETPSFQTRLTPLRSRACVAKYKTASLLAILIRVKIYMSDVFYTSALAKLIRIVNVQ